MARAMNEQHQCDGWRAAVCTYTALPVEAAHPVILDEEWSLSIEVAEDCEPWHVRIRFCPWCGYDLHLQAPNIAAIETELAWLQLKQSARVLCDELRSESALRMSSAAALVSLRGALEALEGPGLQVPRKTTLRIVPAPPDSEPGSEPQSEA